MVLTNEIPQKSKIMDDVYFQMCASKLKCDTGTELERVGLIGIQSPYTISFYSDMESDYQELIVEDFGKYVKGKWVQLEPTELQLKIMKQQINNRVQDIHEELDNEESKMQRYEQGYQDENEYGRAGALYSKSY